MADKILIVDDEVSFRSELRDFLEGFEIVEASSGEEALELLKRAHEIKVVILDVMMPRLNGIDVLAKIKETDPDLGIIILTGYSSKTVAIEALKAHADDYIEKPTDVGRIKESVERLLELKGSGGVDSGGMKGKIEKMTAFIERNCYKKIGLNDVAGAVYLSPKYISKIFKDKMGIGFREYKLKIKMEKAKEFLKKDSLNVGQISDKLGYENIESFTSQFKKIAGSTPTAFRKKIEKQKRKKRWPRKTKTG